MPSPASAMPSSAYYLEAQPFSAILDLKTRPLRAQIMEAPAFPDMWLAARPRVFAL